jgi:hypothetical protein
LPLLVRLAIHANILPVDSNQALLPASLGQIMSKLKK